MRQNLRAWPQATGLGALRWLGLFALLCVAGCDDGGGADPETDAARLADFDVRIDARPPTPDLGADAAADMAADAEAPQPDRGTEADRGVLDALSINSLIPNRGPSDGGTPLRIIGSGFREGVTVAIGRLGCANVVIDSPNLIRCNAPPGGAGTADVTVVWQSPSDREEAVLTEGYTFFEPVSITAVRPNRVPLRGGIEVFVQGTGLIEDTRVRVGANPVNTVRLTEDGALAVVVPAGPAGPATVSVSNFNGDAELVGGLFYYEPLLIDDLDPPIGPTTGGSATTINGQGLTSGSRVTFGGRGTEVRSANAEHTRLELDAPAAAAPGPVDVRVENDNGDVTAAGAYVYFDPAAVGFGVVGLAPQSGPVEGGNAVYIAGSGFTANTQVAFDGRQVVCSALDAHQLRCTAPPGVVGPVAVSVAEGATQLDVAGGYTYFETLQLVTIVPERGAIAGGTVVTLRGAGFAPGMTVNLGDTALVGLTVIDETTAVGTTPPNTAGPVDVVASTPYSRAVIPAGYQYYNPVSRFGGVWGDPIDGAVNVTVLNANSGDPIDEAAVLLLADGGNLSLEGLTNATGQLTLSGRGLVAPAIVTAAKEGFEVTTIEDVGVENVTIYLVPNDGEGDPPPGVPGVNLTGTVTGLDVLPKPVNERYINVVLVDTSHSSPFNRTQLPPPGAGGLLTEDGPFQILARPGELAIIATAGELDRAALQSYQDGAIDYWTMRQSFNPLAMGLRRFITGSPGMTIDNLHVNIDHPMTTEIPIDLDNPPLGPAPGPQYYAVLPRLNLGAEGYWEFDVQAVDVTPSLALRQMPNLAGWDADLSYYLIALAFSATADNLPMSISIEDTRDVANGVLVTPFVGSAFLIEPLSGATLGLNRRVTWGVHDGYDGPIRAPSANMVFVSEPALGPPKPLWRYVTPSLVTEFEFPPLPANSGTAGLGGGAMYLDINPFIVDGRFDFSEFTYDELSNFRWKSWGVTEIIFFP